MICINGIRNANLLWFADKPELYGLAVAVAVTVAALIILTVALVTVIIKCQRRKKIQRVCQGERESIHHINSWKLSPWF